MSTATATDKERQALIERTYAARFPEPFDSKESVEHAAKATAFDLYRENAREDDSFEIYRNDTVAQIRQAAIDFANDCWGDFL